MLGGGLNVAQLPDGRKAIIIRTSDRIAFKQCRRKWGWSSHLKRNLGPIYLPSPLWFGSAVHYALEDFHGYNHFGRASEAFKAYCLATATNYSRDLPHDAQEHYRLGQAMMNYYQDMWLLYRQPTQTYWVDGVPQVEVNFEIEVPIHEHPILASYARAHGADCVLYRGTIDRVAIDENGHLWVVEYKTAKRAETMHFQTDPQVTTYVWACSHIYDRPVVGVKYYQFVKKEPEAPRILQSGKISTASNLTTSYPLYRTALKRMYGDDFENRAPADNVSFLTKLAMEETENRDKYIIRDSVYRNPQQCESEAQKILLELEDMLNPDLPLYPAPTRECSRMCGFLSACVSMDDGSDWESELMESFSERDQSGDRLWRNRLPSPADLKRLREEDKEPNLEAINVHIRSAAAQRSAMIEAGEDVGEISFDMNRI